MEGASITIEHNLCLQVLQFVQILKKNNNTKDYTENKRTIENEIISQLYNIIKESIKSSLFHKIDRYLYGYSHDLLPMKSQYLLSIFPVKKIDIQNVPIICDAIQILVDNNMNEQHLEFVNFIISNVKQEFLYYLDNYSLDGYEISSEHLCNCLKIFYSVCLKSRTTDFYDLEIYNTTIELFVVHLFDFKEFSCISTIINYGLHPYFSKIKLDSDAEQQKLALKIWKELQISYEKISKTSDLQNYAAIYEVLCLLLYIEEIKFDNSKIVFVSPKFWNMIKNGLTMDNAHIKKQSLFLLNKAFEICSKKQNNICNDNEHHELNVLTFKSMMNSRISTLWSDYFDIIESLEEPQVHLMKPLLTKIKNCFEKVSNTGVEYSEMFMSWFLIAFQRAFKHVNKNMVISSLDIFLDLFSFHHCLTESLTTFILTDLLKVLGNEYLFEHKESDFKDTEFLGHKISLFMKNVTSRMDPLQLKTFMIKIFSSIFDGRTWNSSCLFYVVRSLKFVEKTEVWSFDLMKQALCNYQKNLSTHNVFIRVVIQRDLIDVILMHSQQNISMLKYCSLINMLNIDECLKRYSNHWNLVLEHFNLKKSWHTSDDVVHVKNEINLLVNEIKIVHNIVYQNEDLALAVIILTKMEKLQMEKDTLKIFLKVPIQYLLNCDTRPYIDKAQLSIVLNFLALVFDSISHLPTDNIKNTEWLLEVRFTLFHLIEILTNFKFNETDLKCLKASINCLKAMNMYPEEKENSNNLQEYIVQIAEKSTSMIEHSSEVISTSALLVVEFLLSDFSKLLEYPLVHRILNALQVYLSKLSSITEIHTLKSFWKTLLKSVSLIPFQFNETLTVILPLLIETSCRDTIAYIFNLISIIIEDIVKNNSLSSILELMWKTCEDYKKACDLHKTLITYFSQVTFSNKIWAQKETYTIVIPFCKKLCIQSQDEVGIGYIAANQIVGMLIEKRKYQIDLCFFLEVFVPFALCGSMSHKQFKVTKETIRWIQIAPEYDTSDLINVYDSDRKARGLILKYLLSLDKKDEQDQMIARNLASGIQSYFKNSTALVVQSKEFPNSYKHRLKTRLLQYFLVILPLLNKSECEVHFHWLGALLAEKQHLPSVRFFLEYSMALICLLHQSLVQDFFVVFDKAVQTRLGCVASFLASLTLIACHCDDEQVLEESLKKVLPWVMSNQYNIRLYAQSSVATIWKEILRDQKYEAIRDKFSLLHNCLFNDQLKEELGKVQILQSEFFFSSFKPLQHFTLQTLFYELPRLSAISRDEWICPEVICNQKHRCRQNIMNELPYNSSISVFNRDTLLSDSLTPLWIQKIGGCLNIKDNSIEDEYEIKNVQKKVTPWKFASQDLTYDNTLHRAAKSKNLIMVASLIDKLPNLGGLCRTCEIFGVSKYVVASLSVVHDHQFTALSITAHQWVNMTEAKLSDLKDYLFERRDEGYHLIGIEQTAKSISLEGFKFPQKSLILLGNEREGIPCDLIQLMDECVEIPQQGVLRSLNVHVSGAIVLWEYAKQNK